MLYLGRQRRSATFGYLGYVEVNRVKKACQKMYVGVKYGSTYTVLGSKCGLSETVKVKDSRNKPGVTQRVPRGLGFQISMTFGT